MNTELLYDLGFCAAKLRVLTAGAQGSCVIILLVTVTYFRNFLFRAVLYGQTPCYIAGPWEQVYEKCC